MSDDLVYDNPVCMSLKCERGFLSALQDGMTQRRKQWE